MMGTTSFDPHTFHVFIEFTCCVDDFGYWTAIPVNSYAHALSIGWYDGHDATCHAVDFGY